MNFFKAYFYYNTTGASVSKNNKVHKVLRSVLKNHFAHLSHLLQPCLQRVATEMYFHNLVTRSVQESPTVLLVINEFENTMQYLEEDISKLQEHCQHFLQCLSSEGGPMKLAAQKLCQDWMKEVKKQCNISLDLTCDEQDIKQQGQ